MMLRLYLATQEPSAAGLRPLCDKLKARYGILCGVHLVGGVPIKAVDAKLPVKNAAPGITAADIANASAPNGSPPMTYNPKLVRTVNANGAATFALVPGGAEYFKSVVDLLVKEWGVRFIKWDFGGSAAEAQAYRDAIDATGIEVVFNTHGQQQQQTAAVAAAAGGLAESEALPLVSAVQTPEGPLADMYRVSYDMWDE